MKIIRIKRGCWEWRIRFLGKVGQADGFAPSRRQALIDALNRLQEERMV